MGNLLVSSMINLICEHECIDDKWNRLSMKQCSLILDSTNWGCIIWPRQNKKIYKILQQNLVSSVSMKNGTNNTDKVRRVYVSKVLLWKIFDCFVLFVGIMYSMKSFLYQL